jgi:excisionase family DNA binding protein
MSIDNTKDIIGIEELSERLNYSVPYLRRLCREGRVPYKKLGRKYLFIWKDILEWIELLDGVSPGDIVEKYDVYIS